MTGEVRPPIPVQLADRPTVGGLVIPWVALRLADGGVDFRRQDLRRAERCWREQLCQICGEPIGGPIVLFGGAEAVEERLFHEPPMDPVCARYVQVACPMVAGRMARYASGPSVAEGPRGKTCPTPGCGCAGLVHAEAAVPGEPGRPAHAWYAVWTRGYRCALRPDGSLYGGALTGEPLRVRHLSDPPAVSA